MSPGFFGQDCKIMDENRSIVATKDILQLNELTQDGMLICIDFTFAAIDLPSLPYFRWSPGFSSRRYCATASHPAPSGPPSSSALPLFFPLL